MNWGGSDSGLYQVPDMMGSVYYPGGGGKRYKLGGRE